MPGQGWDATGILKPLWQAYGGRDELAKAAGTTGTVLSAINTGYRGRRLGITLARKLAVALNVSLAELGAPAEAADDPASQKILDRLARVEEQALTVADLQPLLRVVQLLAAGKRTAALRALSEAGLAAQ